MLHRIHLNRKRLAGMGLVEIMVALVIGLFGVLVMLQVLSVSEEQKRSTTGGNDAMNEGVLGLYTLQSDIRMAGYGIADKKLMGCSLTLRTGVVLDSLAPVVINSSNITGNDANTDTLLVFYGTTMGTPQGDNIIASGNVIQTPAAFAVNDWVVAAPGTVTPTSPCTGALSLQKVASITNNVVALASAFDLTPFAGGTLFNLGQSYHAVGYAIRGGNLTMCDFTDTARDCTQPSSWISIASNMVSLRAQYGRDMTNELAPPSAPVAPGMDGVVDVYNQIVPTTATVPPKTTACGWIRTPAVRLALVARSAQTEKNVVTTAAPVWDGSYDALGNPDKPIVLSGFANWQMYRYKVFQTMVPLRNLSWMGVVSGC